MISSSVKIIHNQSYAYMCSPGRQPPHLRWHRVCQETTHSFLRPETHFCCISIFWFKYMLTDIMSDDDLLHNWHWSEWPTWSCMLSTRRGPGSSSNWSSSPANKCLKMRTHTFNCFDTSITITLETLIATTFYWTPCIWAPIFGSGCLSVRLSQGPCWDLTDVVDEDTNSMLTDNANRAIQGKQCGNASDTTWWPTLETIPTAGKIWTC